LGKRTRGLDHKPPDPASPPLKSVHNPHNSAADPAVSGGRRLGETTTDDKPTPSRAPAIEVGRALMNGVIPEAPIRQH
jgi:hypothetical protein